MPSRPSTSAKPRTPPSIASHSTRQAENWRESCKPYRYGLNLRWDLMAKIGPLSTRKEAEAAEGVLAAALERRGHRVFWG